MKAFVLTRGLVAFIFTTVSVKAAATSLPKTVGERVTTTVHLVTTRLEDQYGKSIPDTDSAHGCGGA